MVLVTNMRHDSYFLLLNFLWDEAPAWLFFLDEKITLSLFGREVTQTTLCLKKSKLVWQKLWKLFYNCSRIKKVTKKIRRRNQWFHIFNLKDRHILFGKMWNSHCIDIFLCLPLLPAIVLGLQKYHILRKQETFDKTILNYTKLGVFWLVSS